ncbi:MAG: ribosomal protein L13e [Nitrososphaerota archaeon]
MSLPIPVVRRKLKDGRIIERKGRGFSINELREAGITIQYAKKLGIYVDKRRKSCRKDNVETLKMLLKAASGVEEVNSENV